MSNAKADNNLITYVFKKKTHFLFIIVKYSLSFGIGVNEATNIDYIYCI
jgi:hypothetical protein